MDWIRKKTRGATAADQTNPTITHQKPAISSMEKESGLTGSPAGLHAATDTLAPRSTLSAAVPDSENTRVNTPTSTQLDSHATAAAKALDPSGSEHSGMEKHEPKTFETTALDEVEALDHMEEEADYPTGFTLTIITISLSLAVFLVALDNTIISSAIPRITDEFHSLPDIGWYASSYLLTLCAFQLMFGKFYSFFSLKYVFLVAIGLFELGSLICGVAPNSLALIVGRAIAGFGSAGIFSGGLIIIAYSVPLAKRPVYTGLLGGMYGIASVAGPLMGGAFTDHLTWRWCFYINLPLGAVTIAGIAFFFKSPARKEEASIGFRARFKQFDPVGTIVFLPAIVCLLLALQWGGTKYAWNSGRIIALLTLFSVLLVAFIAVQIWKNDDATVPPRIVSQRSVAAGSIFGLCLGGAFFIMVYYMPIWFQAIQGVSATQSGVRSLGLILSQVIASIMAGVLVTVFGYYTPFMYLSSIIMSIGAGLVSTWKVDSTAGMWIGYQVLFGLGTGFGFQQPMMAAQTCLPLADVSIGTSYIMFLQMLGGAMFVSVAQNIFQNKLVNNLAGAIPNIDANFIAAVGATQIRNSVASSDLSSVLISYNDALDSVFQVATALAALSIIPALFMQWRSVKGKKIEVAAA